MADKYVDEGVPFLRSQNILPFRITADNIKFIPQSFHEKLRKSSLRPGDVAIVRTGYPGTAAVVPKWLPDANCADLVIITPGGDLDAFFLAAVFNSTWGIASVGGQLVGAAQQHFNIGAARRMELHVPPLPIQRKIAAILSAYDDLIENNNRRIKILEEMAQRIYREWFVDFRYPGHEDVPLVQSDLGPIPKEWNVYPLSYSTESVTRGVSPKYSEESPGLVINQKCIRDGRLNLDLGRCHQTVVPIAKVLQHGDVLVNSTGVGTLGRVAQVLFEPRDLTVDSHVTIVRPAPETVTADFLGLSMLARQADIAAMGVGSTGQTELNRRVLAELPLLVAPMQLQERFTALVGPLRILPVTLAMITANLQAARDFLLPRLISGEINVDDLEVAVPEIAA
jgi:type I restriction enzyme S subunit